MKIFDCVFGKQKITPSENLIQELFASSTTRKTELIRASFISCSCLHEAGHVMMAELHQIPIDWVNLPRFDAFYSGNRLGETDKEAMSGVSTVPSSLDKDVPYRLGGFFGELDIYEDKALSNAGMIHAFTFGCKGDLDYIRARIQSDANPSAHYRDLATKIDAAMNASCLGAETALFLSTFRYHHLPEFLEFRRHRNRHRSIAAQLYEKWKATNFEHWRETNPHFGPYVY